ncbi:hypothetical protein FACS189446_2570 [Bacteroidia bacterium]|nr:hypothetical protein FACS189446_2570 [Bacteroidia bacterium]
MTVNAQNTVRDLQIDGNNIPLSTGVPYRITHDSNFSQYTIYGNDKVINSFPEKFPIYTTTTATGKIAGIISANAQPLADAYVILVSEGKVSKPTGSDGRYEFDGLIVGKNYPVHIIRTGYQSIIDKGVTASETPNWDNGSFIMEPNSGNIHLDKVLIDMGETINIAAFSINTGENPNLSWKITIDPEIHWISLDDTPNTGAGNSPIVLKLTRQDLSSIKANEQYTRIIVSSTTPGDDSRAELWVTVFGTGQGINIDKVIIWKEKNVTANSAEIRFEIDAELLKNAIEYSVCYAQGKDPKFTDDNAGSISTNSDGSFTAILSGLSANTVYNARAFVRDSQRIPYYSTSMITFSTSQSSVWKDTKLGIPTVTDIGIGKATLNGTITTEGMPSYDERGFCYIKEKIEQTDGYYKEATINDNRTVVSKTGKYELMMTDLPEMMVYWVRAYAIQGSKTHFSDVGFFISGSKPVLLTGPAKDVSSAKATLQGFINFTGWPQYSEKGFCYNYTGNPNISDNPKNVIDKNKTGLFTATVNLTANSTVYVRAYAKNELDIGYGEEIHFKVSDYIELSVAGIAVQQTDISSSIDYNTAVSLCNSSGWRVPSLAELQVIYDNRVTPSIIISGLSPYSSYWSSTPSESKMYVFDFANNRSWISDKTYKNSCRCVRNLL